LKTDWEKARSAAEKHGKQILSLEGVVGISTCIKREAKKASPCIKVYLSKSVQRGKLVDNKIPWELDGVPVEVVVTGDVVAFSDQRTQNRS
jgi:hypothetical protein